jgi:simple sugar transport system permease protein
MALAGAFAGLAGASEVLGLYGFASASLAGDIGFDAIAVALLGRSSPLGTAVSAILFGALQAGGRQMQVNTDVPIDLIVVLRALIVMFIAAPLLVKAIFRIRGEAHSYGQTFRGWGG